ncbi:MAG: thiamine phosphate synthase [Roseburia sp.]|nr:thiamine phosphate synthase [Roseburia sp.]
MLLLGNGEKISCICVTNRKLCEGDFFERVRRIGEEGKADALILREKDLSEEEYFHLAKEVLAICEESGLACILHTWYKAAERLGCRKIHLPLDILSSVKAGDLQKFEQIGTSVHSVEQAEQAEKLGADYVIAGHVFETDCKKGLPGRGTGFVNQLCQKLRIPVYGIGGIMEENAGDVIQAGAEGVCIMSGFMRINRH